MFSHPGPAHMNQELEEPNRPDPKKPGLDPVAENLYLPSCSPCHPKHAPAGLGLPGKSPGKQG